MQRYKFLKRDYSLDDTINYVQSHSGGDIKKTGNEVCQFGLCTYIKKDIDIDKFDLTVRDDMLERVRKIYKVIGADRDIFKEKDEKPVVNHKLFIRDILTKFVVNDIVENRSVYLLIHIINRIMTSLYEKFYDITSVRALFVYRGGNILKLYKNNFENVVPGKVRNMLKAEFDEYFQYSDLDFYTVIKDADQYQPELLEKINNDIQAIIYYGLNVARIFVMNNSKIFKFCNYNSPYLSKLFDKVITDINSNKVGNEDPDIADTQFVGLGFDKFLYDSSKKEWHELHQNVGQSDISINRVQDSPISKIEYFTDHDLDLFNYHFSDLQDNSLKDFYISNNNNIHNRAERVHFRLCRLMISFLIVGVKDGKITQFFAPSEGYDAALGEGDDKMYPFYNSKNLEKHKFVYDKKTNRMDEIYIPNIETAIMDLTVILFYRDLPWRDPKYKKRLYRFMVLIFIAGLEKKTPDELYEQMVSTKPILEKPDKVDFDYLRYMDHEIQQKLEKITNPEEKKVEEQKYRTYQEDLRNGKTKLLKIINSLQLYLNTRGKFFRTDLLDSDKDVIG